MISTIITFVVAIVAMFVFLILNNKRKSTKSPSPKKTSQPVKTSSKKKHSLQEYLPIDGFHESGAMIVRGKFHRVIRVGDVNLYTMSFTKIRNLRDGFRDMLKKMNEPFQISVQARRANYTDYLRDSINKINTADETYQNPVFHTYCESLKQYLKEEIAKPRSDRENLIITGVSSSFFSSKKESAILDRLNLETGYVLEGLSAMKVSYEMLSDVATIEALQNFWNRDRAISQRYRDMLENGVHVKTVMGAEEVETRVFQKKKQRA